jgi:hypothetical protein
MKVHNHSAVDQFFAKGNQIPKLATGNLYCETECQNEGCLVVGPSEQPYQPRRVSLTKK